MFSLNTSNEVLEEELVKSLGLPYKALKGSYEGKVEKTYMVLAQGKDNSFSLDMNKLSKIKKLAFDHNQECVLVVASSRDSILEYANGNTEHLGKFSRCDKAKALLQKAWTYDAVNDQYWVAGLEQQAEVTIGKA